MCRTLAEGKHRIVDSFPDVGGCEQELRAADIAGLYGVAKRRDVALLEIGHESRPGIEAGFAGHGELRIGKLQRSLRRCGVGAHRMDACERRRVAVTGGADQILRELVLLFEAGGDSGRVRRGHGRPPSILARVRIWAEEESL
jgi:hypothetical protein